MSTLKVNAITDASGGNTATINSMTPTADSLQGFRNRIINGSMVIDQRNAGASVTPANTYTLDRWQGVNTQASKFTVQQNAGSVTPPDGFTNYLGATSSSAYSVLTGDTFYVAQYIEGFNCADLAWGTANAKTITISFWVRSSLTGTFGGSLANSAGNRAYPFSYTISSANTWEQKTITIAGDTTGTWLTNNGTGIQVRFGIGSGSTYTGTAGAWGTANAVQSTGSVSVVGTNGATFYITGVQLEVGSVATPFERRPYGTELALCQRYFVQYQGDTDTASGLLGYCESATAARIAACLPVAMRASPTGALSGTARIQSGTADSANFTSLGATSTMQSPFTTVIVSVTTTGMTANAGASLQFRANGSKLTFSAEL